MKRRKTNNDLVKFKLYIKFQIRQVTKFMEATGQFIKQGNIKNGQIFVSELIKGGYVISVEERGKELFTSKFIKK